VTSNVRDCEEVQGLRAAHCSVTEIQLRKGGEKIEDVMVVAVVVVVVVVGGEGGGGGGG
jgi:hypothetical protein